MSYSPEQPLRWGILGCGSIAGKFAEGLQAVPQARLVAAGSRSQDKAEAFAGKFGAAHFHGSYEALARDPDVDAVYVATPHPMHAEDSILCLQNGKAVLCEKPFMLNAAQAERVIGVAQAHGLFLMEGMWSRFFPLMDRVREIVRSGAIGDVRMVQCDFGFRTDVNPQGRLFSPALGGGALLDVGVYSLSLASMLLGTPTQTMGVAQKGETGVDEQAAACLMYEGGRIASLTMGTRTETPHEAFVLGTEGRIKLHAPWWKLARITLTKGGKDETIDEPFAGNGMNYEAAHVGACLEKGRTESDIMPLAESLEILRTMDALRAQWGVRYPGE